MGAAPIWKGAGGAGLNAEAPTSRAVKWAERISYTEIFEGPYSAAFTLANLHYRGSIWTLSTPAGSATFFVDDTSLEPDKGQRGKVTINYTYCGSVPADEFSCQPFEDNPPIERNRFFATLSSDDLAKCKAQFEAASAAGRTSIQFAISNSANVTLMNKLVNKWLQGKETFYLAALKFSYTQYSYTGFTMNLGGFRQSPFGPFSSQAPASLSWLRQSDELSWNNGVWKLTYNWLGANGTPGWDSDLYP